MSALAILISCLGLFGLASFTAERRTKEVGIRKVLGASARDVVLLLSKNFIGLVFIANLIAEGRVTLAGKPAARPSQRVAGEQLAEIDIPPPTAITAASQAMPLSILY